jgi:CHAD domain-containing protein
LLDALDTLVAATPEASSGDESEPAAPVTIDSAYKRVRKAAKAAARVGEEVPEGQEGEVVQEGQEIEHDRDEALHRIRKRAKRLRYTAAATGADQVSQQAKAIQSLLGDHQDSVVSRQHLIHQTEAAHTAGEDTFTYGLLYQQEADLAESCRRELDGALRKLNKAVRKARG